MRVQNSSEGIVRDSPLPWQIAHLPCLSQPIDWLNP